MRHANSEQHEERGQKAATRYGERIGRIVWRLLKGVSLYAHVRQLNRVRDDWRRLRLYLFR